MPRIAYLASTVTLPGSPNRRSDAFEHDRIMEALRPPFAERGLKLVDIAWDDPNADWSGFDMAIIGTTWDYWDRPTEFLETLEHIASQTQLENPVPLVRWNSHKAYLRELEARGAPCLPTLWFEQMTPDDLDAAFTHFDTDDLVLKRQVGAGADGQYRVRRGDPLPVLPHPMMVQPFLSTILDEGEFSFIFIDGSFSHALQKRPATGDYRIQSSYGGTDHATEPNAADLKAARAILSLLDAPPLYARVDMLRGEDKEMRLMEIELIEPFLYPLEGPQLGTLMAEAVVRRLAV